MAEQQLVAPAPAPVGDSLAGLSPQEAVEVHMINLQQQLNTIPAFNALQDQHKYMVFGLVEPVLRDLVMHALRGDNDLIRAVIDLSASVVEPTSFINTNTRAYEELYAITMGKWGRKSARDRKERVANQHAKVAKIAEEIEAKKKELQQEKTLLHILQQLYTKQQDQQHEDQHRQLLCEKLQQQFLSYQEQMKSMIRGVRDGTVVNPQQQFTNMFAQPPVTKPTKRLRETPAPPMLPPSHYPALIAPPATVIVDDHDDDDDGAWTSDDDVTLCSLMKEL